MKKDKKNVLHICSIGSKYKVGGLLCVACRQRNAHDFVPQIEYRFSS